MTVTFTPPHPIWCAGCGHFGVKNAIVAALAALDIPAHDTMILAGIGCSGTVQNNIEAYGYHALHGRVLPTAMGVKLANPHLTVIAAGGDGDGYAIGGGHLMHSFKRNPGVVYVLMNNGIYGLTKGQRSPAAEPAGPTGDQNIDGIALGLSIPGSTFLARGYSGASDQLNAIMEAAIRHANQGRGFAFVEVMSPCVTYNDTYVDWSARVRDVAENDGFDRGDRVSAFAAVHGMGAVNEIPTGIIFEDRNGVAFDASSAPAHLDVDPGGHNQAYSAIMENYAF